MNRHISKTIALTMTIIILSLIAYGCTAPPPASQSSRAPDYYGYNQVPSTAQEVPITGPASEYEPRLAEKFEESNTEEYSAINDNVFKSVLTAPLSTFSADVDTASYSNLRRMINDGSLPYPDAVRIEEMINYFYYDYPEPEGTEPFSVTTEITDCPWNKDTKLMLIGLQAKKIQTEKLPPSNLVFLLDVSGSMEEPNKLPLMKRAFSLLTEQISPRDKISLVTYASSDKVLLSGVTGENKGTILSALDSLSAGGSTAGSQGIITAYKLAEENFIPNGNNRIILGTDGDLNVGVTSEGELKRLIEDKRKTGVYLSVMGFGTENIKDNKMETLADNGNGNYSYVDSISEARKVLVEEMGATLHTVAKDVKFQVEFNPKYLKGYRLIGYENRLLENEDFADDTKDAGEIGSGHRVTVLYEIVPVDSPFKIQESTLKYQSPATIESNDLLTVNIRYKEPDVNESTLLSYPLPENTYSSSMSDNLKLASSVAEFGMLLRKSEHSGTASFKTAIERLKSIKNTDTYIDELIYLIGKSQGLD